jgi:1,4-dihydroxy-2-naphthoate octaprenyltransferase
MSSQTDVIEKLARLPAPVRWVIAARFKTVGLSVTPVLCGTWVAAQAVPVDPWLAVLAALSAVGIQVGTNLWNDAADAERGTDTAERLGPPRMTALGLLDGSTVKRGAALAFAAAVASGLPLVVAGGWPIVVIGLLALLLGYSYSMGPVPLSHTPLGEVIVIAFFGVIAVMGTAHVLGAFPSWQGVLAGVMMGLPSGAVLLLNNHRDRQTDAAAGRRTLAILVGTSGARFLYAVLVAGAVAMLPVIVHMSPLAAGLGAMAMVAAVLLALGVWRTPVSAGINRFLPLTVLLQFALFLALALSGATAR